MVKVVLLSVFSLVAIHRLAAQDMVYYTKNKPDAWKVTEITPQYIRAVDSKDPDVSYSATPADVLLVFRKDGHFIYVPGLQESKSASDGIVKGFFNDERSKFDEFDKIITNKFEIITCTYESMGKTAVVYKVGNTKQEIPHSKVAAIIFRTGNHKLLAPLQKVSKVLGTVQEEYYKLASAQPKLKTEITATGDSSRNSAKDSITKDKAQTIASKDSVKQLEPSTVLKLQNKALVNIKQLGDYIQLICQKDTDPDELAQTVEQALALFVDDARIEVSSINRENVNQFKIRDYLKRLSYLKYQKVIIEWYNIQYTSLLRKGPDGFYYGTIEFEQRFVGISADNVKYEDITRKSVEVVLKTYERNTGGQTTLEWDVFLGDIGVTVTKSAS